MECKGASSEPSSARPGRTRRYVRARGERSGATRKRPGAESREPRSARSREVLEVNAAGDRCWSSDRSSPGGSKRGRKERVSALRGQGRSPGVAQPLETMYAAASLDARLDAHGEAPGKGGKGSRGGKEAERSAKRSEGTAHAVPHSIATAGGADVGEDRKRSGQVRFLCISGAGRTPRLALRQLPRCARAARTGQLADQKSEAG
jgi:hypothetical protein